MKLSEIQEILLGGLQLLHLEKDNIIIVMLMLKLESQQMNMLIWLKNNIEKNPTQEQIMDIAQKIMHEVK
jgi:hypothetical protein